MFKISHKTDKLFNSLFWGSLLLGHTVVYTCGLSTVY